MNRCGEFIPDPGGAKAFHPGRSYQVTDLRGLAMLPVAPAFNRGISLGHEFQIGGDMLVEYGHTVELFQQIERDVRLVFVNRLPHQPQVVAHAERFHLMSQFAQCDEYIVFRLPVEHLFVADAFNALRRNKRFIHQDHHAQFLHNAILW